MKRTLFAALAIMAAAHIQAQDPFTNYQMVNTTDLFGTARYVAMGGAMGALGTDISAISNNPASLGLFRKNDISISMGGQIQDAKPYDVDSRGRFSFDQVGFVACFPNEDRTSFFNFGLNLQKKNHYGNSFFVEGALGGGLSQTNQLSGLYSQFYTDPESRQAALPVRAFDALLWDMPDGIKANATDYDYNRLTTGNLYGLDMNFSGNLQDRFYLGATVGLDFLNYRTSQRYVEYRDATRADVRVQDYDLTSNRRIHGTGFNVKLGAIVRPFEEDPFRIGVTVETPTWYVLTQDDSYFSFASKWKYQGYDEPSKSYIYDYLYDQGDYDIYNSQDDNFMDFNVFSPWKFRAQMGSTVSDFLAWDVEYEYAMYDYTKMGYPESYNSDGPTINMDKDRAMTTLQHASIQGVHNIRAGLEIKPLPAFAARVGYNYWSRPSKNGATFDQGINSYAMDYILGTEWMNLGATNMFSFGIGFRHKSFYADSTIHGEAPQVCSRSRRSAWTATASTSPWATASEPSGPQNVTPIEHAIESFLPLPSNVLAAGELFLVGAGLRELLYVVH